MALHFRYSDRQADFNQILGYRRNLLFRQRFLQIFILFTLVLPAPGAADSSRIKSNSTFVFGVNNDFAPYEYINAKNEPDGYTIDLIKAVAKNENLNIKLVFHPWHIVREKLLTRELDGATAMLYSKERDTQFDFSLPYKIVSYAIFKNRAAPVTSISDIKNKEILVVKGVYAHDWLTANLAANTIVTVEGPREALELLASRQHDFAVLPRLHGIDLLNDLDIDTVETMGPPVLEQKLCFAVAEGYSDLLAELNEGLFALQQTEKYDEIYSKWFSVHEHKTQTQKIIRIAVLFLTIAIFLFLVVLSYNWILKRKVNEKTEALRHKEARLSQIVEGIPIPTYVVDERRKVTHWNKACEALTGKPAGEIVGTNDYADALFGQPTDSIVDLLLENALNEPIHFLNGIKYRRSLIVEGAYKAERYINTPGSGDRWIMGTATLLKEESGNIIGAIETWQDLTEYKVLEKQLFQSQKMEAIGTLAGGIAHDFNNILSAIIGYGELGLMDVPEGSASGESLSQILAAGMRAKKLVNQILTFSRQTEGERKPVQLSAIVVESIELLKASLPPNIKIQRDIQSNALMLADSTHIHQVVMNLLSNAIHAMSKTGGVLSIRIDEIQVTKDQINPDAHVVPGTYVHLTINDTGQGIPSEVQSKIFNPFFTTKKRGKGTGLGLSVVHGIVKQHDGFITLNSVSGKFTTFEVFFPVLRTDATGNPLKNHDLPFGSERILIIDNDEVQLEITEKILNRIGYGVVTLTRSLEALKTIQSVTDSFDLVIINQQMPEFSGEQFAAKLMELKMSIPIIFLASYSADSHKERAMALGIKGTILKPIVLKELAELIRGVLDNE